MIIVSIIMGIICVGTVLGYLCVFEDTNLYMAMSQIIGGFVGGILTLIGVMLTMKYESAERKKDNYEAEKRQNDQLRLQVLPVLKYDINYNKAANVDLELDISDSDKNIIEMPLNIVMENIGLNTAVDLKYQIIIDEDDKTWKIPLQNSFLPVNSKNDIKLCLKVKNKYATVTLTKQDWENSTVDDEISILVMIYYKDIIGNYYAKELKGRISANMYSQDDKYYVDYNMTINTNKESKVVSSQYIYEVSEEEKNEKIERIKLKDEMLAFQNSEYYNQIMKLVDSYTTINKRKIFSYIPIVYKKVDFRYGGGGIIRAIKIKEAEKYRIIISNSHNVNSKEGISINYYIDVNIKKEEVKLHSAKIKNDTLNASIIKKIIARVLVWWRKYA